MSNCCSSTEGDNSDSTNLESKKLAPKRHRCPSHGEECKEVAVTTILHHLKTPWHWTATEQAYYFCESPDCDVVYFGEDETVITTTAVRTTVGIKQKSEVALVCYCFGVSFADAVENPESKRFVIEKTKNNICACDTRNPSGRCCLKDFPKTAKS